MTPTTKETCQTRAYGRLGKGDKSHAAHARRTRAHARRIVPTPAALGGPKRTSSPRPLAPVCCSFAAAFSVHTIILLTQEPLADWKALLPPSLAAPKRHAHTVDAREQALDSLPARRPEDCDPVRSPPDGPSSAALAVLLAVGARRAVKAEESDPCSSSSSNNETLRPCLNARQHYFLAPRAHSLVSQSPADRGPQVTTMLQAQGSGLSLGLHQDSGLLKTSNYSTLERLCGALIVWQFDRSADQSAQVARSGA